MLRKCCRAPKRLESKGWGVRWVLHNSGRVVVKQRLVSPKQPNNTTPPRPDSGSTRSPSPRRCAHLGPPRRRLVHPLDHRAQRFTHLLRHCRFPHSVKLQRRRAWEPLHPGWRPAHFHNKRPQRSVRAPSGHSADSCVLVIVVYAVQKLINKLSCCLYRTIKITEIIITTVLSTVIFQTKCWSVKLSITLGHSTNYYCPPPTSLTLCVCHKKSFAQNVKLCGTQQRVNFASLNA